MEGTMANKKDFTADEWAQLQHGLAGTVLLVSVSDPGLFDTFKEASTAAKHYAEARRNNASELVRELSADAGMGFGLGKNPQQLETETMSALRAASTTLKKKAPDDADAYKQFVLEVAQSVAEAAKDASAAESAEIDKVRSALTE
jgi:protein-disulfide isomerase-like protein with CxxC motif